MPEPMPELSVQKLIALQGYTVKWPAGSEARAAHTHCHGAEVHGYGKLITMVHRKRSSISNMTAPVH